MCRRASSVALLALCCSLRAAPPVKPAAHSFRVPVWADSKNDPPALLAAKDLSATLDGDATRVLSVKGPDDGLMLLVVLDLAGDLSLAEPATKKRFGLGNREIAAADRRWQPCALRTDQRSWLIPVPIDRLPCQPSATFPSAAKPAFSIRWKRSRIWPIPSWPKRPCKRGRPLRHR